MSLETHTFDPNGDVVLMLNRHVKIGPISPTSVTGTETTAAGSGGSTTAIEAAQNAPDHKHKPTHVNMLVSSKHMILASSVFEAMLKNQYMEGRTLASK